MLWKTQKPFAISYNVTNSAVDGTESESNAEQNQLFGPNTSTQLQPFDRLQLQAMDSPFSLPKITIGHIRK